MPFYIELPCGKVRGFSRAHQCVQITKDPKYVLKFNSKPIAQKFIDTYSDAGYGMSAETAVIKEVSTLALKEGV
jgi:hypothetical protein